MKDITNEMGISQLFSPYITVKQAKKGNMAVSVEKMPFTFIDKDLEEKSFSASNMHFSCTININVKKERFYIFKPCRNLLRLQPYVEASPVLNKQGIYALNYPGTNMVIASAFANKNYEALIYTIIRSLSKVRHA